MKQIPLTDGKFTTVDDEDFDELMKVKWQFHLGYASRQKTIGPSQRRRCAMHREILGLTDSVIQVDRINGDRLDNRKMN